MPQYRSPRPTGTELFMTETLPQLLQIMMEQKRYDQKAEIDSAKQVALQQNKDREYNLQVDKFTEAKRKTKEAEKMSEIKVKTDFTTDILKILDDLPPEAAVTGIDAILDDAIYQTTDNETVNSQREQLEIIQQGKKDKVADNAYDKKAYDDFVAGNITFHEAVSRAGEDSTFLDNITKEDTRRRSVATHELNTLKTYAALGSAAFTHPEQPGVLLPRGQKLIQRIGDALDKIAGGAPIDTPQGQKDITLSAGWRNKNPTEVLNELLLQMGEKTIELQEDIVGPDLDMFPLDKEFHVGGEPGEIPPTTYRKMHAETESFSKNPRHPLYSKGGKDASGRPIYEYEYLFKPENDDRLEVDKLKGLGDTRSTSLDTIINEFAPGKESATTKAAKEDLKQAILPYSVVSEDVNTITINFNEKDIRMPKKAWVKVKTGEGRINSKRAYKIVAKKLGISVDDVKELMFGHLKKAK